MTAPSTTPDKPAAVLAAEKLGHTVEDDPTHPLSSVMRWTCTRCGDCVLDNRGHIYGSATTSTCGGTQ